jgi:hypothetical protein
MRRLFSPNHLRRIFTILTLPVVCRVNINIKPQTVGEFGRNDSRDLIFAPGKLFDFGLYSLPDKLE